MTTITCTKCEIEKDKTCFHNRRTVCKECVKKERKEKERAYLEKAKDITKTCTICTQLFDGTHFKYDSSTCSECTKKKNNRVANKPTEDMPDKTCTKCNLLKKATDYRFRTNVCIECEKQDMYKWRQKNPEKFKEHLQRYRSKPEYKEKNNAYKRNKYNSNIMDRISHLCRHRIRQLIREKKDGLHLELLGCNYSLLLKWLEYNFKDSMSWDNYGDVWHIDHIIPCSSFNLENIEDQYKCFRWTNMAPLDVTENIKKGNKILPEYISYYEKRVIEFLNIIPILGLDEESL
jgi:hypothetical protein